MLTLHWFWVIFAVLAFNTAYAQSAHAPLSKGDRAYDKQQYKVAERNYRAAADREMGNPQALYNLGNTLYQQGNFEDAESRFLQASNNIKTPLQMADALHNLGDAFLKQRKYKDAVRAYEQSLRLRPADPGTKQNLQLAKKRLKEEQKKEQEKQQQNQQQQDKQSQNQDQKQDPKNQENKQQDKPGQPEQNQPGQAPQSQDEQQKKIAEKKLKKEEASRLLETAIGAEDRKNARKYRAADKQSKPKTSKKDW